MAITKIHPIKSTLNLAIEYIVNGDKTDDQILVSTHKCHESTAHTQFLRTRGNAGTKGTVLDGDYEPQLIKKYQNTVTQDMELNLKRTMQKK